MKTFEKQTTSRYLHKQGIVQIDSISKVIGVYDNSFYSASNTNDGII